MKNMIIEENTNSQRDTESVKEWINPTLRKIHRKMVELFNVNFTYFRDIKIIKQPELLKQLTERMRNSLKENGMVYSDTQWKQICEILSKNQVTGFFENFAFYNPKDEALYLSEKMIRNHPEKIVSVCAHELSEKLLSTYLSSSLETPIQAVAKVRIEAKKANNTKPYELLDTYTDIIFKSVFKEWCCEAIALQTLRNMGYEIKAASLEKELQIGHSKCINLLFEADNARRSRESIKKVRMRPHNERRRVQTTGEEKLVKGVLRSSQIIKGVSYYLGYPLAKAVLEKYGVKGVKLALEKQPPLKAQYFANPQAYLTQLGELKTFIEQRR